jgi:hypothetical protein
MAVILNRCQFSCGSSRDTCLGVRLGLLQVAICEVFEGKCEAGFAGVSCHGQL